MTSFHLSNRRCDFARLKEKGTLTLSLFRKQYGRGDVLSRAGGRFQTEKIDSPVHEGNPFPRGDGEGICEIHRDACFRARGYRAQCTNPISGNWLKRQCSSPAAVSQTAK